MSYRLQCPKCNWVSYGIAAIRGENRYAGCSYIGPPSDFNPTWIAPEGDFRAKTSADILARLLASPHTRVEGPTGWRPFNSDTDLPELAETAVNAADALIVALSRPPNEALVGNRVVKAPEVIKEVVKEP